MQIIHLRRVCVRCHTPRLPLALLKVVKTVHRSRSDRRKGTSPSSYAGLSRLLKVMALRRMLFTPLVTPTGEELGQNSARSITVVLPQSLARLKRVKVPPDDQRIQCPQRDSGLFPASLHLLVNFTPEIGGGVRGCVPAGGWSN